MKSDFKRTSNRNKSQSKVTIQTRNSYLDYLIDPSFQGVYRLFVLSFENNDDITAQTGYFLPKVETKSYNVMIGGQNIFDQPVKSDMKTCENIGKVTTAQ